MSMLRRRHNQKVREKFNIQETTDPLDVCKKNTDTKKVVKNGSFPGYHLVNIS